MRLNKFINNLSYNITMKKILFSILFFSFFFSLVSAYSIGQNFKAGSPVLLKQSCSTCSYNTISAVYFDNSEESLISEVPMVKNGVDYTYLFTDSSEVGVYTVTGYGDPDGNIASWSYTFSTVDYNTDFFKFDFSSSKNHIVLIILGILFVTFLFFKLFLFAGVLLFILGVILLFNSVPYYLSLPVLVFGVVLIFNNLRGRS